MIVLLAGACCDLTALQSRNLHGSYRRPDLFADWFHYDLHNIWLRRLKSLPTVDCPMTARTPFSKLIVQFWRERVHVVASA